MTNKTKGRSGWHQATSNSSKFDSNFNRLQSRIKAVIITFAVWGLLPSNLAAWIIRHCHLGDS